MLAQDVARVQITGEQAFGDCFPPAVMALHIVRHLADCQAHAVIVVPDTQAAVQSLEVAPGPHRGMFSGVAKMGYYVNDDTQNER